jgi:hypothetical protein
MSLKWRHVPGHLDKGDLPVKEFQRDKFDTVLAFFLVLVVASPTALQQLNFHEISLAFLLQYIQQVKGLLQGKGQANMQGKVPTSIEERSLEILDNLARLLSF